ncbi:hypothetical protein HanRHA438_Chr15g0728611 [Helianthus annuus]|nr:hypothetical protein HanIR_Chr15g0779491 [Helianthus annuus]KAJ0846765.1 hypothetical protein HanRHA438_Chr15g0728611 [Helianthus annuus]
MSALADPTTTSGGGEGFAVELRVNDGNRFDFFCGDWVMKSGVDRLMAGWLAVVRECACHGVAGESDVMFPVSVVRCVICGL